MIRQELFTLRAGGSMSLPWPQTWWISVAKKANSFIKYDVVPRIFIVLEEDKLMLVNFIPHASRPPIHFVRTNNFRLNWSFQWIFLRLVWAKAINSMWFITVQWNERKSELKTASDYYMQTCKPECLKCLAASDEMLTNNRKLQAWNMEPSSFKGNSSSE